MAGSGDTEDRVEGRGGKEERAREGGGIGTGILPLCVPCKQPTLWNRVPQKHFWIMPGYFPQVMRQGFFIQVRRLDAKPRSQTTNYTVKYFRFTRTTRVVYI